jgi:hypothetical protein
MKKIIVGSLLVVSPMVSFADDGLGCGWGETVMEGKTGLAAHLSAGTTNGTFANQTFGMTSGTAGCDTSQPLGAANFFIQQNKEKVALDFSRGEGESLAALSEILNIEETEAFGDFVQGNFASIYSSSAISGGEMVESLVDLMKTDEQFAKYVS